MKYNQNDLRIAIDSLRSIINANDKFRILIAAEAVVDMYDSVYAEVCGTPIEIWITYYEALRNEKNYEEADKLRDWLHYEGLTLRTSSTGVDYEFTPRPIERAIDRIQRRKMMTKNEL